MELTRDRFIDQFAIPLHVTCLRLWRRRARTVPVFLGRSFYETMTTSGGHIALSQAAYCDLVLPLIVELHRSTPRDERPEGGRIAGLLYDALNAAGVEVTIQPFVMITPAK
jgi:hypothetical protein